MANIPARPYPAQTSMSPGQTLCIIVGLACLAGFIVDITVLGLPPEPFNVQWRANLLQQVGNRSIVLLFGFALLINGLLTNRGLRKQLSLVCLALGVMFSVSGVVMIHDSLKIQDIALSNIASQEDQVRSQIESVQDNPQELAPELTPEILNQASQQLSQQVSTAKQSAKTGLFKLGASSVGNLIVTGLALIAIGRFGTRTVG